MIYAILKSWAQSKGLWLHQRLLWEKGLGTVFPPSKPLCRAHSLSVVIVVEFVRFALRPASCWQFKSLPRLDKRLSGAAFLSTFNFRQFTKTMF